METRAIDSLVPKSVGYGTENVKPGWSTRLITVAVRAPVGGGKSSLLAELVDRLQLAGTSAEGFIQVAVNRGEAGRGAGQYDLRFLPGSQTVTWAVRDESLQPPYRFSPEAAERALTWAKDLSTRRPSVVVLDEFGRVEMGGGGHRPVWDLVTRAEPDVVVVGVRDEFVAELGEALGIEWDAVVDARSTRALPQLLRLCDQARDWEWVGRFGAATGAVEMSFGTALHAGLIPGRGLMLSTLQAVMLTAAAEGLAKRRRVSWVAQVAAGLKALSPAGSRLRPMLAISIQGVLFGLPTAVLPWSAATAGLGGALVGAWSAAQGLLLQYLAVGSDQSKAYDIVVRWIAAQLGVASPGLPAVLAGFIGICGLISGTATFFYWRHRHRFLERITAAGAGAGARLSKPAWRELTSFAFWLPVALIGAVLLANGTPAASIGWMLLRAIAVSFALFALVRLLPIRRTPELLRRWGWLGPATALSRAFRDL